MQHKLESGYKSVKQQQSISPPHQAPALSSSVSLPTTPTCLQGSGGLERGGAKAGKSSQIAWILSGLWLYHQYNDDLKKKSTTTNQTNFFGTRSPIVAPGRNQCYHPSAEHDAPTAAAEARGTVPSNSLCWRTRDQYHPGSEAVLLFRALSPGLPDVSFKPGFPSSVCSGVSVPDRWQHAHYRKGPAEPAAAPGSAQTQRCHPAEHRVLAWAVLRG